MLAGAATAIPLRRSRQIHARFTSEPQHILQWNNYGVGHRRHYGADECPVDLFRAGVEVGFRELALELDILGRSSAVSSHASPPPQRRVVIARAGIGAHFARIIMWSERRPLRIFAKCKLQHGHARESEPMPQP